MSYCVNCGVELDASLEECPLCNTPVVNPTELVKAHKKSPFPKEKVPVEMVKRKDIGMVITIVLMAIAFTCVGLNLLVFNQTYWSGTIVGACLLLWVILFPIVIYQKLNVYVAVLFDGLATLIDLYLTTWLTDTNDWFYGIGLAIVILITVIMEIYILCMRTLPKSILTYALYTVTAIGVLCVGIECIVEHMLFDKIMLDWSAIVATICIVINAALIAVLSIRRLRNAVRRRLHF